MRRGAPEFLVLALDIGSSSTRSALFDEKARMIAGSTRVENMQSSIQRMAARNCPLSNCVSSADVLRATVRAQSFVAPFQNPYCRHRWLSVLA